MSLSVKTVAVLMGLGMASSAMAAERTSAVRTQKAVGPIIIVDRAVRTDKAVGPLGALVMRAKDATSRADHPSGDSAVLDLNQGF
ncbi:MAG TPA: hypothetical protein VLQ93_24455 [Myxococcaceae bacterium]|nr:hypothetical protein [Myxococcaceae bacterium]